MSSAETFIAVEAAASALYISERDERESVDKAFIAFMGMARLRFCPVRVPLDVV